MGLCSSTLRVEGVEVDTAVEVERTVVIDVDVQSLVIRGSVDKTNGTSLYKVVRDDDVLLVRSDFDVVGTNGGLNLIRVI